jgi:hypothetical protein
MAKAIVVHVQRMAKASRAAASVETVAKAAHAPATAEAALLVMTNPVATVKNVAMAVANQPVVALRATAAAIAMAMVAAAKAVAVRDTVHVPVLESRAAFLAHAPELPKRLG